MLQCVNDYAQNGKIMGDSLLHKEIAVLKRRFVDKKGCC